MPWDRCSMAIDRHIAWSCAGKASAALTEMYARTSCSCRSRMASTRGCSPSRKRGREPSTSCRSWMSRYGCAAGRAGGDPPPPGGRSISRWQGSQSSQARGSPPGPCVEDCAGVPQDSGRGWAMRSGMDVSATGIDLDRSTTLSLSAPQKWRDLANSSSSNTALWSFVSKHASPEVLTVHSMLEQESETRRCRGAHGWQQEAV
mmetsp:Transcript_80317/g.239198  ORF Transcript_80317/g.239198 Transcript_80317/m.239198 type:complete len:203 (-) Transcript_80317:327-935(-)